MIRTIAWWTLRHAASRVLLAVSLLAGCLAVEPGYSPALAFQSGVGTAVDVMVYFGPFVFALTQGTLTDAHSEENRLLAGCSVTRQRFIQACFTALLVLAGALLALAIVTCYGLVVTESPGRWAPPDVPIVRELLHLVLVALAVPAVSLLAMTGRTTVAAIGMAVGMLVVTVVVQYSGAFALGVLLRATWPPYAAQVVSLAGQGYSPAVGALAAAGLVAWVSAAAWRLTRSTRLPEARRSARATRSGRTAASGAVVAFAVLSMFLPSLGEGIPAGVRPSLWIQRVAGQAPDQVTERFFDALQQGELDDVRAMSAPAAQERLSRLPGYFLRRSPNQRFSLRSSPSIRFAEVEANIVAGRFFVCLRRVADQWAVSKVSTMRCEQ